MSLKYFSKRFDVEIHQSFPYSACIQGFETLKDGDLSQSSFAEAIADRNREEPLSVAVQNNQGDSVVFG